MVSRKATRKRKAAGPILPDDSQPSKRTTQSAEKHPASAVARQDPAGTSAPDDSAEEKSRVLYIGHVPHGFYEQQMREFFSQFGRVTRVRLSRNKTSARSKGYAFVEFANREVAGIAAEAMDGYMMFKQKLVVSVMPAAEVHPQLFKGANKVFKKKPWAALERERHEKDRTESEEAKRLARAVRRDQKRQEAIAKAGIEYAYQPLAAELPSKPVRTVFDDDE